MDVSYIKTRMDPKKPPPPVPGTCSILVNSIERMNIPQSNPSPSSPKGAKPMPVPIPKVSALQGNRPASNSVD